MGDCSLPLHGFLHLVGSGVLVVGMCATCLVLHLEGSVCKELRRFSCGTLQYLILWAFFCLCFEIELVSTHALHIWSWSFVSLTIVVVLRSVTGTPYWPGHGRAVAEPWPSHGWVIRPWPGHGRAGPWPVVCSGPSLPICSHHGQSEPVAGRAYHEACLILIIATVATAAKSSICRSLRSTAGIASTS